jgi:hypothetical protein
VYPVLEKQYRCLFCTLSSLIVHTIIEHLLGAFPSVGDTAVNEIAKLSVAKELTSSSLRQIYSTFVGWKFS